MNNLFGFRVWNGWKIGEGKWVRGFGLGWRKERENRRRRRGRFRGFLWLRLRLIVLFSVRLGDGFGRRGVG